MIEKLKIGSVELRWCVVLAFLAVAGWKALPTHVRLPSGSSSNRLALVIGISDYEHGTNPTDGWPSLSTGPDVANIRKVLHDCYGFQDIEQLTDAQATQEGLVAAFRKQLIAKASPGDSVVFYYTGHGYQIPDQPPGKPGYDAEPDGLDECLVTWLSKEKQNLPEAQRFELMYMRDDVLDSLTKELAAKMTGPDGKVHGTITYILDSCHSGSGARGSGIRKGRPWDGPAPKGSPEREGGGWDASGSMPQGSVLISGCESGQSSLMMDDRTQGSALTYHLCQALTTASARGLEHLSYRDIFEPVRAQVLSDFPSQNPQLEGMVDALIFGDGTVKGAEPFVLITTVKSGKPIRLTLESGSLAGITLGSKYNIFRASSDTTKPENKIAEATVSKVESFSSTADVTKLLVTSLSPADLHGTRAVVSETTVSVNPLRVKIDQSNQIFRAISQEPFVATQGVTDSDFDFRMDQEKGKSRLRRKDGEDFEVDPNDSAAIINLLRSQWRWKELSKLETPANGPRTELDIVQVPGGETYDFGAEIPESKTQSSKRTKGGGLLLETGDSPYLVCRNTSGRDLYMTVLYLDAGGSIHVWPDNRLAQESVKGDGRTRALWRLHVTGVSSKSGEDVEVVKLIATKRQVDLSGLKYDAASRPAGRGDVGPLQQLLLGFQDGNSRGYDFDFSSDSSWSATQIVVTSREKK